jgi:predicted ABC-type ATPase
MITKRHELILIRGHSGSGKSYLSEVLRDAFCEAGISTRMISTDDHFTIGEDYEFDASRLTDAHAWCRCVVEQSMRRGVGKIIVHNTFTQNWEMDPFKRMAEECGYRVTVYRCENEFDNVHSVPEDVVDRQRERMEDNIERDFSAGVMIS